MQMQTDTETLNLLKLNQAAINTTQSLLHKGSANIVDISSDNAIIGKVLAQRSLADLSKLPRNPMLDNDLLMIGLMAFMSEHYATGSCVDSSSQIARHIIKHGEPGTVVSVDQQRGHCYVTSQKFDNQYNAITQEI